MFKLLRLIRRFLFFRFKPISFKATRPIIFVDMTCEIYSQFNLSNGLSYMVIEFVFISLGIV